ncbi:MAG: hypothetical protein IPN65_08685 [Elusimicrobia bacterium]|jgi:hypothetical protein|nr:hypothetical protein [Elusimicrobiota bacterium]MBK7207874.1 hypothetical protein [Elusimicrobiota bacterium]MBK7544636.1 hypothetical protein [Elusimicrobiota bacterium]MBK7574168.1 hypothetical protein [Elusimicrobiota bacterium]MBK7688891.1 hypothetical protein [Elusimicrobiota bacterium]
MNDRPEDAFKRINFQKPWEEKDWERYFDAQDRLARGRRVDAGPARAGIDPSLAFGRVLRRFGMDPDNPDVPPQPFAYSRLEPSEEPLNLPGIKFWQPGADQETLPIYCQAKCYAWRAAWLVESRFPGLFHRVYRSPSHRSFQKAMENFLREVPDVPRQIAAGHRLGYDPHGVKGNIVRCRRALETADRLVGILSRVSRRRLPTAEYEKIWRDTTRLRTALIDWIDLLRARFAGPGGRRA